MVAKNNEEGLTSRYSVRKALGDYHPWKGFEVTDTLSGKDYLLFSLPPGSRSAICASDLSMRNSLFPGISRMTIKALSLQESEGGITFLLPEFEFTGLESACRAMKPDEAAACLGEIVSGILETLSGGLFFGNLSPGSLVVSGGKPVILPVAYLIPCEILGMEYYTGGKILSDPLLDDLASLGEIIRLFCPHLAPGIRSGCAAFAEGLASLDSRVSPDSYYPMMEGARLLPGCENARIPDLILLSRVDTPHVAAMNRLRIAAERAREGGKHMVIVRGKGGEGKSTFLKSAMSRMREEWGLEGGAIPGDKGVFQDLDSGEEGEAAGFAALDDHFEDSILGGFFIDKLARDLEHRNLVLVTVDEKADPEFVDCLRAEGTANRFIIDEIELPAIEGARKAEMAAAQAGPATLSCMGGSLDGSLTLMELSVIAKSCALAAAAGKGGEAAAGMRVPEGLTAEERSVLDFIAVFRFEVPLSILQRIYSTEEKGFFSALQKLLAMGLVQARAETSSISGGKICLLFRINGRSMGERIRSAIPPSRKKELHLNIAQFLKDVREAPAAYIYYHLARCSHGEEAAFKGLEIFHLLLEQEEGQPDNALPRKLHGNEARPASARRDPVQALPGARGLLLPDRQHRAGRASLPQVQGGDEPQRRVADHEADRDGGDQARVRDTREEGRLQEGRGPSEKGARDARGIHPGRRQGQALQRPRLGALPPGATRRLVGELPDSPQDHRQETEPGGVLQVLEPDGRHILEPQQVRRGRALPQKLPRPQGGNQRRDRRRGGVQQPRARLPFHGQDKGHPRLLHEKHEDQAEGKQLWRGFPPPISTSPSPTWISKRWRTRRKTATSP